MRKCPRKDARFTVLISLAGRQVRSALEPSPGEWPRHASRAMAGGWLVVVTRQAHAGEKEGGQGTHASLVVIKRVSMLALCGLGQDLDQERIWSSDLFVHGGHSFSRHGRPSRAHLCARLRCGVLAPPGGSNHLTRGPSPSCVCADAGAFRPPCNLCAAQRWEKRACQTDTTLDVMRRCAPHY